MEASFDSFDLLMPLLTPEFQKRLARLLIFRDLTLGWCCEKRWCEVGVDDKYFSQKGFSLENFQSLLRRANSLQSALDRTGPVLFAFCPLSKYPQYLRTVLVDCHSEQSPSEDLSVDSYAVVAAAAVLLSLVYLYLTGDAARGGSIPYSSGSLDFRDTYIPIILFHGAYVWIKSRDVAHKGVYRRLIHDKRGNIKVVYEPRFKPSHRKGEPSHHIYVGQYDTPAEASILYQITAICYNGQGGLLQIEDGNSLTIPPMTDSDRRLTGAEKRKCVGAQVRRVYEAFKAERANAAQPRELQAVGVDCTNPVSLNPADATTHGAPLPINPTHNSETGIAPCGNHGLDSLCEMCIVGLGFPSGDGVDAVDAQAFRDANNFQEGVAASITQSGTSFSSENELALLRSLVSSQQEVISLRQQLQELSEARHQLYFEHQQLKLQVTQLQNRQCFQPLEPQEFSIQHFQPFQDELQGIDQGMLSLQACVDPSLDDLILFSREWQFSDEDEKPT
ncbi:hypothetical protein KC19_2G060200 [Ceratodon purpureus]|uniref:Uncharacterized protein n=1 Tax=Ceratodon purpureus TaxID=3225 RepID=A0A8T0IUK1_CERPU|nr:hypothetical protein KC19_2G060200 [Ceratodon purpureus]